MRISRFLTVVVISATTCIVAQAQTPQHRIALVVGEGAYANATLPTAVNDAGLIAQALNDSGFEIVEGRDLDLTGLHQVVREFLAKVEQGGPDTEAAIYFSGYAAQLEGDNFLLPVDARIGRASDLGISGVRLSDLLRSLNAATHGVKIVIVDAPRGYPALQGQDIASGLALVNAPRGMLVAYATAPGYIVPEGRALAQNGKTNSNYGIYATALADQIYQPGIEADEVFKRVRLQVHGITAGVQVPWHSYAMAQPFYFSSAQGSAQPLPSRPEHATSPDEAYAIAIETDTISGYQTFLKFYPDHPLARRIKVLLANRREAVIWNRTVERGTPEAYWSYLRVYSRGPHAEDARRRLALLSRPLNPPEDFAVVIYDDVPPPITIERNYEQTYIYNDYREYYNYPPPPPPPAYFLPHRRPIPWAPPIGGEQRRGFLPVPPRPAMLPPPVWHNRPAPPRAAPIMPFIPGQRPGEALPLPGGAGRPLPPKNFIDQGNRGIAPGARPVPGQRPGEILPGPGGAGRPLPPKDFIDRGAAPNQGAPVIPQGAVPARPDAPPSRGLPNRGPVAPQGSPQSPVSRPAPQPGLPPSPQERVRPVERPTPQPIPQERVRPIERPAPPPVQQERPRPIERPAPPPVQQERPRPIERPAPPPVQQERPRPIERPAPPPVQQERPRSIERPAPPAPAPAPVQPRPSPPPAPVQQPPRQMEQRPAPSSPPPVIRAPEPQRQAPPPNQQQRPDRKLRPGEQP